MASLKEQAIRLLREKWANPTILAQELYAILSQDFPLDSTQGATLDGGNAAAPLPATVRGFGDDGVFLLIKRPKGDVELTPDDVARMKDAGPQAATLTLASGTVVAALGGGRYAVADEGNLSHTATCLPSLPDGEEVPQGAAVALLIQVQQAQDSQGGTGGGGGQDQAAQTQAYILVPTWL
jgi:hypothetical protein